MIGKIIGWTLGSLFVGLIILATLENISSGDCKYTTEVLKGVNGITDENNGLLSSGDSERTSLLLESGRIISFDYRVKELYLNQPVIIKECEAILGSRNIISFEQK